MKEDAVDLTDNKNDVLEKFLFQRKFDVLGKFPSQRNPVNNDNDDDARDILN